MGAEELRVSWGGSTGMQGQGPERRARNRGFTLVELVIVIVIVGMVAVVTGPLMFSTPAYQQSGFFNETLAAVRYAQKLAVSSGCPVRVSIATSGYSLWRPPAAANCAAAPTNTAVADPSDPGIPFAGSAPSGVTLSPAGDIVFTPDGRASSNVTVTILSRSFRVYAATGFVERL